MDREGPPLSVSTHPADHHEVTLVQLSFEFYMIEATPGHLLGPPLTLIPPAASGPPLTFGGWNPSRQVKACIRIEELVQSNVRFVVSLRIA